MTPVPRSRDVVVFDLGGVLVRWDPAAFVRELAGDGPEAVAARDYLFGSDLWKPLDRGGIAEAEMFDRLIAGRPDLGPTLRAIRAGYKDRLTPVEANVAALARFRAERRPVYLLSNIFPEMFAFLNRKFEFFGWFDGMILSHEEGVVKPDPEIYLRLCRRFGFGPERAVFADDLPMNTAAAVALGFATVTVTPGIDLEAEIRRRLTPAGSSGV